MPAPVIQPHIDEHFAREFGKANYTVSAQTVTMTSANVKMEQLDRLIQMARTNGHDVSLVSGVLTVKPR
jgi:hypothetical protein